MIIIQLYTMIMLRLYYDYAMIILWLYYDYTMIMLWLCYDYAMIILWLWYDYGMIMIWLDIYTLSPKLLKFDCNFEKFAKFWKKFSGS